MSRDGEVAVVGAGVMGLAAARGLARAGHKVTLLEQFRVGHARGSSHGTSRIFRLAYEDPEFVRLARRALPLWRELEQEAGERLLETTGSLDVGTSLDGFVRALDEGGAHADVLDAGDLRRRFRTLRLPDGQALYHAEGGILHANRAISALRRSALALGVELREGTAVRDLELDDGAVRLETTAGGLRVGAAIVTAGSWAGRLIELPVTVTRETVAHFELAAPDGLPTVIDHSPPPVEHSLASHAAYALKSPGIGLKAGVHGSGVRADPDIEGATDDNVVQITSEWAAERFPLAARTPAFVETCLYTSTRDERFVVERRGRVVVASACSGHGFKFAPEIARQLAALAGDALAD